MLFPVALRGTTRSWPWVLLVAGLGLSCPRPAWTQPPPAEVTTGKLAEAQRLEAQITRLREARQYQEAQSLAERALAIKEAALGAEHPEVATSLNILANLYFLQGDYAATEPLFRRALAIREQALGPEHLEVAKSLNNLAVLYSRQGRHVEAEPILQRVLPMFEKSFGPEHPNVARILNNLASQYRERGRYIEAEPLFKRSLTILEKTLGSEHPDVASGLENLAIVAWVLGEYGEAEPLFKRTLAIREKVLGAEHPDVAQVLNNLALIYQERGEYGEAGQLYERALAIREKAHGTAHPEVAKSCTNLATLYSLQGRYAEAEPLYNRALAIEEKALGPEHPNLADSLHGLGSLYYAQSKYAEAEPLYRRALTVREKALGPEHPDVAKSLAALARLYRERGQDSESEPLFARALTIREKALGREHPQVATNLYDLALLRLEQNRADDARRVLAQALAIQEANLSLNLPAASQPRNLAYLASLKDSADLALHLHLRHLSTDPEAARLALEAALSRKGRVLEEATLALTRLRRRLPPSSQQLLQDLDQTRAQLAALIFQEATTLPTAQYQVQVSALRERVRVLENELADAGAGLRSLTRPLTLQSVQQALPKDAVLIEFVLYRPFHREAASPTGHFGPPRYAAYLLPPVGPPRGVDLGEAKPLDALIRVWRAWLLDPTTAADGRVTRFARQLHQKLLAPLGSSLGSKHLILAPDGQLNTLPFAALVDPEGRSLLQRHTLSHLVSGRELLRLAQPTPARPAAPLVLGGPDFVQAAPGAVLAARASEPGGRAVGEVSEKGMRTAENLRSPSLTGFTVRPLPGARQEAATIARLLNLPATQLLTGPRATENALKAARSPAILHLATHGFFLEDQQSTQTGASLEEPLLRAGVALAGFNSRSSGTEDGVLTALEAQGLDLEGTEMAVLSACQSGAGPVVGGEGVQGLRRSLALAGARSQVLALWPVADRTTAELMEQFYRKLTTGMPRSEALRQAQLVVAAQPGRSHPYWWAAFVPSGDWRPLRLTARKR